jgi:hypothetical protein
MKRLLTCFVLFALLSLSFRNSYAQWVYNGTRLAGIENAFTGGAVSDGAGGAIITWYDLRGATYDLYARRISALGVPLWLGEGTLVSGATSDQVNPVAVSDGAGGAIIAWEDKRNGATNDVYVQRMNATGSALWTANGVALCTAGGNQVLLQIASDGAGGAIIGWMDFRGAAPDIYARRVTAAGVPQWAADGVAVCVAANLQGYPVWSPTVAGEAVIVWDDERGGLSSDVYAQKLNNAGAPQWVANGRPVTTAPGAQGELEIATDDLGGALVTWGRSA